MLMMAPVVSDKQLETLAFVTLVFMKVHLKCGAHRDHWHTEWASHTNHMIHRIVRELSIITERFSPAAREVNVRMCDQVAKSVNTELRKKFGVRVKEALLDETRMAEVLECFKAIIVEHYAKQASACHTCRRRRSKCKCKRHLALAIGVITAALTLSLVFT